MCSNPDSSLLHWDDSPDVFRATLLIKHTLLAVILEEKMATHSSVPAWRIPWAEEPGGLQSMGSQRVGHN